jgi:transposase InsO family protein
MNWRGAFFRGRRIFLLERFIKRKTIFLSLSVSEFKAEFTSNAPFFCERHRVARPYRKNEQSYIESFNRTVRKECLGWQNYRPDELAECTQLVESFLKRYHYHRPHMGLGMTPPLVKKEVDCRIFTEN